ncbi:DNA polymerase II large subunit [Candidatus Micrarchaeota archaeon]|nr:DNA polymerase II large subunit [Candidatus Micrarchaeota archaeon]
MNAEETITVAQPAAAPVELPWEVLELDSYFKRLDELTSAAYGIAEKCRSRGLDVETKVEIPLAADIAARVEGTVGPVGVATRIRELLTENKGNRDAMVLQLVKEIIDGRFGYFDSKEETISQCIRTSLAIWTEGILAASTEGFTRSKIMENNDGTKCLAVFFAGPISSAGGTAKAQAVLIGDFVRKIYGLDAYKPTDTEVERYVEEVNLYHNTVSHMQFRPKDDDLRWIIRNCPVCIDGESTDSTEVSAYKNLPRMETNRVRGGMCKVIGEGIAQKALKVMKLAKVYGSDWSWLEKIIKIEKKGEEQVKIKPIDSYLADIVGGRPIFAYPSTPGGFRLRYGRCRNSGINAKAVHPSLMYALNEFIAIGTQLKIERPGKGAGAVPCDSIEPPVVLMNNGDVIRLEDPQKAREIRNQIKEILFLGDILVCFGDFVKSNHNLMPSGIVEEWWDQLARQKGLTPSRHPKAEEAVELSQKYGLPLHPSYTYFYGSVQKDELASLVGWLSKSRIEKNSSLDGKELTSMVCEMAPEKRVLEKLCVPHRVVDSRVVIDHGEAVALIATLGLSRQDPADVETAQNSLELVNRLSSRNGIAVWDKAPVYIGGRMGRPEKAKERLMSPAPHGLIPVGDYGGKVRSIIKAAEKSPITVDLPYIICPSCRKEPFGYKCADCNERVMFAKKCASCGKMCSKDKCDKCGGDVSSYHKAAVDMLSELKKVQAKLGEQHVNPKAKGVIGTMNAIKAFEPLEKAVLRAKHNVYVFKDGTIRFDASNLPLLYFRPGEIGLSVEKARELGYMHDYNGNPLVDKNQLCELKCQDIVVAEHCMEYLLRVSGFIDDLMEKFYGEGRFYNCAKPQDLIGQLVISIAPHTSAGVIGRVIGSTRGRAIFAHPYFHTAQRRDCFDGNTMMYYKNDDQLHANTIASMFDKYQDQPRLTDGEWELIDLSRKSVYALGADVHGSQERKKIRYLMRKPYRGQLIQLLAENRQELTVTPDHPLWVFDERTKQLKKKLASELTKGDLLASLSLAENHDQSQLKELDLVELFSNDEESDRLTVRTSRAFSKTSIRKLGGLKQAVKKLGRGRKVAVNSVYRDPYGIPLAAYRGIRPKQEAGFRIGFKRNFGSMPLRIMVDESLLRLVGYYVSEGWAWVSKTKGKESYHVGFAASDPSVKEDIKKCLRRALKMNFYEDYKGVYVTNKLCYKLFTEKLGLGRGAYEKDIPDWVLNLPDRLLFAFLGGCYQGDGNVYGREIKYSTVSEKLASKLYLVLTKLGMSPTFKIEKDRPTNSKFLLKRYEELGKTPPITTLHHVCTYSHDSGLFANKVKLIGSKGRKLGSLKDIKFAAKRHTRLYRNIRVLAIKSMETIDAPHPESFVYDIQLEPGQDKIFACGKGMLLSHNCDGDEDAVMLLMDGLLNFSRKFLPDRIGGKMDAPMVLTTRIDASEVDDQAHEMEMSFEYPLAFYEACGKYASPSSVPIKLVKKELGKPSAYYGMGFTHDTSRFDEGPNMSEYVQLESMYDKVKMQLEIGAKIRAVDEKDVATRVINFHFMRDLYGNLRTFGQQSVRCVDCNAKYRRVTLTGKCWKCGGKLLLTVTRGGIEKYLQVSKEIAEQYGLSDYLKQRLKLIEIDLNQIFTSEKTKQFTLADFA